MSLDQRTCRHDSHFVCLNPHNRELPSIVWGCGHRCGYWLNFNPVNYLGSVALLDRPSPDVEWKHPPELTKGIGP